MYAIYMQYIMKAILFIYCSLYYARYFDYLYNLEIKRLIVLKTRKISSKIYIKNHREIERRVL